MYVENCAVGASAQTGLSVTLMLWAAGAIHVCSRVPCTAGTEDGDAEL